MSGPVTQLSPQEHYLTSETIQANAKDFLPGSIEENLPVCFRESGMSHAACADAASAEVKCEGFAREKLE